MEPNKKKKPNLPTEDELTTAMHSEFTIDSETERKHRVFTLLTLTGTEDMDEIEEWARDWNIPMEDVKEFMEDFKQLENTDNGDDA